MNVSNDRAKLSLAKQKSFRFLINGKERGSISHSILNDSSVEDISKKEGFREEQ